MSEATPKTLADLKAGDEVTIETFGGGYVNLNIRRIERITPTGRFVVGGSQYCPDGYLIGHGHSRTEIRPVTADDRELIAMRNAVSRLDSLWAKHRKTLPSTVILAMIAILEAAIAPTEGGQS